MFAGARASQAKVPCKAAPHEANVKAEVLYSPVTMHPEMLHAPLEQTCTVRADLK